MDIKTFCVNCVFCHDKICEMGVYEKLKQHNYSDVHIYSNEDGEIQIDNHICVFCRFPEWVRQHPVENLKEVARREIKLKCTIIIELANDTLSNLTTYIQKQWAKIATSTLYPTAVIFINNSEHRIGQIFTLCNPPKELSSIKWSVENVLIDDFQFEKDIGLLFHKIKTPYTYLIKYSTDLQDILHALDQHLNDDLKRCILAIDDNQNYIVQTSILRTFGNIENIQHKIEEQQCQTLVTRLESAS